MANVTGETKVGEPMAHPEVDDTAGEKQRLRIHVPTGNTTFLLGQRRASAKGEVPGDVDKEIGYTGINGVTVEHVFVSSSEKTGTLQTYDRLLFQSTSSTLTAISKNLAFVGSSAQTLVAGKEGVTIMGGSGPAPEMLADNGDVPVNPKLPDLADLGAAHDEAKTLAGEIKDEASSAWDDLGADRDKDPSVRDAAEDVADGVSGVCGTDEITSDFTHAFSKDNKKAGVALHGKEYVAVSGKDVEVVASNNLNMMAKADLNVGAGDRVEVIGKKTIHATAGDKIRVSGGSEVAIVSKDKTELKARSGTVDLKARTILVGDTAADGPQEATDDIKGLAKKNIHWESDDKIKLNGDQEVKIISAQKVIIEVSPYKITVESSKIKIENGGGSSIELTDSQIKLSQSGGEMKVSSSSVKGSCSGSSYDAGPSGVTLKGSLISIG